MAQGRLQPIATALTDPDIVDALNDLDALIGEVVDHRTDIPLGATPSWHRSRGESRPLTRRGGARYQGDFD